MSLVESVDLADYMDEIAVFGLDPMTDGLFLTVVAYRDLGLYYEAHDALLTVERQASLSADLYLLKGEILVELGHDLPHPRSRVQVEQAGPDPVGADVDRRHGAEAIARSAPTPDRWLLSSRAGRPAERSCHPP